jgi:copper transport protein
LRTSRAAVGVALAIAITPSVSRAHAALLTSAPKAGASVASAKEVRHQFSEEVIPDLCHVALMTTTGEHIDLKVASDPHDVRALVAPVSSLAPGAYRVMWHVVSADGHPVSGQFGFSVGAAVAAPIAANPSMPMAADSASLEGGQNPFPIAAALARGIGVLALLSLAGLLVFASGHAGARTHEYFPLARYLAVLASIALLAHLILWDKYVLPGGMFTAATWQAMLASSPGRLELLRVIVTLIAGTLVTVRVRPQLSAIAAAAGVVVTGMIGHPASTSPALSIPTTVVHLAAVALWSGGILSLIVLRGAEPVSFRAHALLVSKIALVAFIVTAVTGAIQSALLLTAAGDLLSTTYGRLILAKIAGLLLLGAFGAHHRVRVVPRLPHGGQKEMALSLRYEMTLMCVVIVVAAFLSYTPLPR